MLWIANVSQASAESNNKASGVACISITNPGITANLSDDYAAVLRVQFHDYDGNREYPPGAVLFSRKDAIKIAQFARIQRECKRSIIVHCAAGVSRSGAIAEALLEAFPEYEDAGGVRYANGRVKAEMKRALGLVPIGA